MGILESNRDQIINTGNWQEILARAGEEKPSPGVLGVWEAWVFWGWLCCLVVASAIAEMTLLLLDKERGRKKSSA